MDFEAHLGELACQTLRRLPDLFGGHGLYNLRLLSWSRGRDEGDSVIPMVGRSSLHCKQALSFTCSLESELNTSATVDISLMFPGVQLTLLCVRPGVEA